MRERVIMEMLRIENGGEIGHSIVETLMPSLTSDLFSNLIARLVDGQLFER